MRRTGWSRLKWLVTREHMWQYRDQMRLVSIRMEGIMHHWITENRQVAHSSRCSMADLPWLEIVSHFREIRFIRYLKRNRTPSNHLTNQCRFFTKVIKTKRLIGLRVPVVSKLRDKEKMS